MQLDVRLLLPEIALASFAILVILLDLVITQKRPLILLSILGILVMASLFWPHILARELLYIIPIGFFALGSGAFVPSALALMADTAPETKYGATMGLYSFALGFGFFLAEFSGLLIIAGYAYSLPPDQVEQAVTAALQGLFYLSLGLIALAVVLMMRFFLVGQRERREAEAAVRERGNGRR